VEWTLEEVKAQAQKMKLKPLPIFSKSKTPATNVLEKIRKLVTDGKIPQKGTIRREALEDAVMQELFVKRNENNQNENHLGNSLDDSDDLVIPDYLNSVIKHRFLVY
jgi:hypothetical protein